MMCCHKRWFHLSSLLIRPLKDKISGNNGQSQVVRLFLSHTKLFAVCGKSVLYLYPHHFTSQKGSGVSETLPDAFASAGTLQSWQLSPALTKSAQHDLLRVLDKGSTRIHSTIASSALQRCDDDRAGQIVWAQPMQSCALRPSICARKAASG